MKTSIVDSLAGIESTAWNRLISDNNPFLKHEFLSALERHDCVGKASGWLPQHILVHDDQGQLIGASPLYIKFHSHGEFVFDWAWADAYQRNRLAYYPKLVCAVPQTPMSGPRLLANAAADTDKVRRHLINAAIQLAVEHNFSSCHWLFPNEEEKSFYQAAGLALRMGCQYHWFNHGYQNFDHYLSHFSSRKRKNVIKERRQVAQAGVTFRILHGDQIGADEWRIFHKYYREIYDRKWGFPTLTLGFFEEIGKTLAEQVVLVLAYREQKCIATALNLRSDTTLYGRHWGCSEQLPGLHFETCYYQGLEYCMQQGLQRFEPGAQGEHKIARGFLPSATWSAHWIAQPDFRAAINQFVATEAVEVSKMMQQLMQHSPFHKPD